MKTTIYKKRICLTFVAIIFMMASLSLLFTIMSTDPSAYAESNSDVIGLERHTPTIDENFEDNKVIVTLEHAYSEVNQKIDSNRFTEDNNIKIKSIQDLTYFPDPSVLNDNVVFNQILSIELQDNDKQKVLDSIVEFEKLNFVLAAEPSYNNIAVDSDIVPNDPYFPWQWNINYETGSGVQNAWSVIPLNSTSTIKVGIFEDSVQSTHPDLRVIPGYFTPSNESELAYHGTHVAGIIGAITNNNLGVSGIANVEIALLLREDFVGSLTWAIANDIKIINASYRYIKEDGSPDKFQVAHANALRMYGENGGLFIAAAGNDNSNTDVEPIYPAGYADKRMFPDIDNVISVGAMDVNGRQCNFSNHGQESVQIFAPGEQILSTYPTSLCAEYDCDWDHYADGYHYMSGTSMAAPHVAGVAALLLANSPNLSLKQIKEIILDNAELSTYSTSWGPRQIKKLNAYNAVADSINLFDAIDLSDTTTEIIAVNSDDLSELIIPSVYRGKTVVSIGSNVIRNKPFTSVYIPETVLYIKDMAFVDCSLLTDITIPSSVISIGYRAFSRCDNLNISVNSSNLNYSAQDGVLYNKDKSELIQACNITSNFVVPDTVTEIAPYAFESNANIEYIRIANNTKVGDNAFANCANLGTVRFDSYDVPEIGTNVFFNDNFTIVVPYNAQSDYKAAFSQYAENIVSDSFFVEFVVDGQVMETRLVYYGSTVEDLPVPSVKGYDFEGWYDNEEFTGNPYQNGELWEREGTLRLYAKIIPKDCTVIFDANGGIIEGDNFTVVKYGQDFKTDITATKEGHDLNGWYYFASKYVTADGCSTKPWDRVGTTTLKADWSPKSYEIRINDTRRQPRVNTFCGARFRLFSALSRST